MKRVAFLLLLLASAAHADITVNSVDEGRSWTHPYTPPAGTDRLLVAAVAANEDPADGSNDITAVELGTATLMLEGAASRHSPGAGQVMMSAIATLTDANLVSGNYAITTADDPPTLHPYKKHVYSVMLEGVDQTTPLVDAAGGEWSGGGPVQPTVNVVDGGIAIFVARPLGGTDITTVPTGYTQANPGSAGNGAVVAYKLITADGTESPVIGFGGQGSFVLASYRPGTAVVDPPGHGQTPTGWQDYNGTDRTGIPGAVEVQP